MNVPLATSHFYATPIRSESLRLLKLLQQRPGCQVPEFKLQTFNLVDHPAYYALSYTWGNPESSVEKERSADISLIHPERGDSCTVLLNGKPFTVLQNLYDALQQIISSVPHEPYFWIDAICINQSDLVERGAQVSIIGEIYQRATLVYIWLGKSNQDTAAVMQIVSKLAAMAASKDDILYAIVAFEMEWNNDSYDLASGRIFQKHGLPYLDDPSWSALLSFFERSWFSRAWIIQEVALAQDAQVLWGSIEMSWATLAKCSDFFYKSSISTGLIDRQMWINPSQSVNDTRRNSAGLINNMRRIIKGSISNLNFDAYAFADRLTASSDVLQSSSALLALLLYDSRSYRATDPRDHVFATLGILNQTALVKRDPRCPIKADYHKSTAEVYLEAMKYVLENTQSLNLLALKSDQISENSPDQLPSWVPDFTAEGPLAFMLLLGAYFDASRCRSNVPQGFSITGQNLSVKGISLGHVSELSETCADMVREGRFEKCMKLVLNSEATYPFTGQNRIDVFWRTLIADQSNTEHPASDELGMSFRSWLRYFLLKGIGEALSSGLTLGEHFATIPNVEALAKSDLTGVVPDHEQLLEYWERFDSEDDTADNPNANSTLLAELVKNRRAFYQLTMQSTTYRRLLRSSQGHIGLGPQSMQVGDVVLIVSGSQMPLVVRKADLEGMYHLVGEAYIHGVQHGESIDQDSCWQSYCLV